MDLESVAGKSGTLHTSLLLCHHFNLKKVTIFFKKEPPQKNYSLEIQAKRKCVYVVYICV